MIVRLGLNRLQLRLVLLDLLREELLARLDDLQFVLDVLKVAFLLERTSIALKRDLRSFLAFPRLLLLLQVDFISYAREQKIVV